jgi:Ni,Fe-hydrogenase maturation factor
VPGVEDHDESGSGIVLVIGVGNDLRGDDGAGRAVVEQVTRAAVPGVRAIWSQQLVPELVEPLATARLIVFVDATHPPAEHPDAVHPDAEHPETGNPDTAHAEARHANRPAAEAGVVVRRIEPGPPAVAGHSADPTALLGLARLAGYPVPPAYLISVPAGELGLGTELTPATRDAVTAAVHAVLDLARSAPSSTSWA